MFLHSLKSSLALYTFLKGIQNLLLAFRSHWTSLHNSTPLQIFFLGSICFSNSPRSLHKDLGDYIRLCYPEPSAHLSSPPTASASLYYWAWEVNMFTDCKDCGDDVLLTQYASSKIVLP